MLMPQVTKKDDDIETMYSQLGLSDGQLDEYERLTDTISALVLGLPKVGKTRLLGTSVLPLLIYSFDPKSTAVLWQYYPKLMKERWIVVFPFWKDGGFKNPIAYKEWEKVWEKHIESGILEKFGTVAIDSYTGWLNAAGNYWLWYKNRERRKKGGGKEIDHLAQGDYPGLYDLSSAMIHQLNSGNWHFLTTCHLLIIRDEERGIDLRTELLVYKSLKVEIPRLFSENYVLMKYPTGPNQVKYSLLTDAKGIYTVAGSQLRKDGLLSVEEIPNLRYLFKKAGKVWRDKPHWKTGEAFDPSLLPDWLRKEGGL